MEKENIVISIFKFGLTLLISWFLVVCVFACVVPDLNTSNGKYDVIIVVLGFLLAIAFKIIISYNSVQRVKQMIPKLKSDIKSVLKMRDGLLNQATILLDKYLSHEGQVMTSVAEARSDNRISKIKSSKDIKLLVENYPDLKANDSVMKILDQLERAEEVVLSSRLSYTNLISKYNSNINSFPFVMLKGLFKLNDITYEEDLEIEE